MTILAIESATDMVGVALIRDDGAAAERVHVGGRAHAELLVPAIEEVCAVSGCSIADVDHLAVDVGPGLFTGLRVGVATAKALAQSLGVGVVGVTSLDILAAAAAAAAAAAVAAGVDGVDGVGAGTVASIVDARRGEVFAAVYRFSEADGAVGPVDPEWVRDDRSEPLRPEDLVEWLVGVAEVSGRVTAVGDGALRYRDLLSVQGPLDLDLAGELSAPPPLVLARLALRRLARGVAPLGAAELVPDYRRPADARINWEQRAPRVGARNDGGRR